ncbi:putative T6SS immunity periplasmic lipoprotein [Rahnella selenatireducens]|uniref:putative T6SS immunity periplasmic lipoprotein n=1 Tax=Rahnella selenatireducens TaxID=3389797 RepID=UPI0039684543
MVKQIKTRVLWSAFLSGICLLVLTGCPGPGDRMRPDETAQVSQQDDSVCFNVTDAQDYQPADMGINPRGIPSKNKNFNFSPDLKVTDGKLCIPPSFYRFPDKGQFIVEYILTSAKHEGEPRKFVVTLEVNHGHIYNVTPTEREISLPYCRYALDTPLAACQR